MLLVLQRARWVLRPDTPDRSDPGWAIILICTFGVIYGALMGCFFDEEEWPRALQAFYSAVKVPLLLILTFALALPSFYVLNMLLGLAADFPVVIRALLSTQAGLTVILSSLAPFTVLFYLSTTNYDAAILFNGLMFGTASLAAQRLLKRAYAPLIAKDPRHRTMVRVWIVMYAFVGIQMGWVLRPFIGQPGSETTFFRAGAWGNAYVEVWDKARDVIGAGKSSRN